MELIANQSQNASTIKFTTHLLTNASALLAWYSSLLSKFVGIQHAQLEKGGMVKDVSIYHAHLTPGLMEPSVFVQIQKIDVCPGKFMMVKNVYTSMIHVPKVPNGMVKVVLLLAEIVRMDFINKETHVKPSLKDVFLLQFGTTTSVLLMEYAHMALSQMETVVNHTPHAQMVRLGTQVYSNALAQKVLDGTEKNVLFAQEVSSGTLSMVVLVPKDISWLGQGVKSLPLTCVN